MNFLSNIFKKQDDSLKDKKSEIAELLRTTPEALEAFEKSYWDAQKTFDLTTDNFFQKNSRMASDLRDKDVILSDNDYISSIIKRITDELLHLSGIEKQEFLNPVTLEELRAIPEGLRPDLTGQYIKKEIKDSAYLAVLWHYKSFLKETDPKKKFNFYMCFLQGLDLMDLDPVMYEILSCNRNSMEHWFYALEEAVKKQTFFKVPKTKIVKVPLPILQLTRLPYSDLSATTLKIVDEFCMKAFDLDVNKEYFIKTGTFSSKFDFRNAVVRGEKEVLELGEYLLYIHHQALQMASMLNNVSIPGVSTTNHWVVREYIPDKENNPCIYKGMPLHTEYRFFVDFDECKVLGVSPYWREDVMKKHFSEGARTKDPDKLHDYVIYTAHEPLLYQRYNDNVEHLSNQMEMLIPTIALTGQWSIDVMQNGEDFWIIDMALANESALNDVVPKELLKNQEIDWLPKLEGGL